MDYRYGSIKILIIFIVGVIWFLGAWIISSIQKKRDEKYVKKKNETERII
ncbi:hypothetical protein [Treponema putidum]